MKLFIHIGLHKTGTTTFQTFLHLNRKALLKVGVFYPEMGEHESHWVLPNQLVRNNWAYVEDFMRTSFQTAKEENVETVEQLGSDSFLYGKTTGNQKISIKLNHQTEIQINQDIKVGFNLEDAHWFDNDDRSINS